jgi:Ca2+-binding EF-hand superfamily protein
MPGKALALALLLFAGTAGAQADDYFARVDTDGDNRVSLDEFLLKMSWAFSQRDVNHDDILQPSEQHYAGAKAITIEEHRARFTRQFVRQDVDADGYLSRREFLAPPR